MSYANKSEMASWFFAIAINTFFACWSIYERGDTGSVYFNAARMGMSAKEWIYKQFCGG
jgi:hypothetical protein